MVAALQAHNRPDPGSGRPCLPNRPLDQPNHPRFEPVDREKAFSLCRAFKARMPKILRRRNAELSVAFVYPDKHGRFVLKQVGMTHSYGNGRRLDDSKAGDYLDVAIL
ncbi:Histone deacetylase complex subunit SAP18 [Citrus sinensis]|nr:Histone deacetylase complex subunit SAP18 [Citrus sinensis]